MKFGCKTNKLFLTVLSIIIFTILCMNVYAEDLSTMELGNDEHLELQQKYIYLNPTATIKLSDVYGKDNSTYFDFEINNYYYDAIYVKNGILRSQKYTEKVNNVDTVKYKGNTSINVEDNANDYIEQNIDSDLKFSLKSEKPINFAYDNYLELNSLVLVKHETDQIPYTDLNKAVYNNKINSSYASFYLSGYELKDNLLTIEYIVNYNAYFLNEISSPKLKLLGYGMEISPTNSMYSTGDDVKIKKYQFTYDISNYNPEDITLEMTYVKDAISYANFSQFPITIDKLKAVITSAASSSSASTVEVKTSGINTKVIMIFLIGLIVLLIIGIILLRKLGYNFRYFLNKVDNYEVISKVIKTPLEKMGVHTKLISNGENYEIKLSGESLNESFNEGVIKEVSLIKNNGDLNLYERVKLATKEEDGFILNLNELCGEDSELKEVKIKNVLFKSIEDEEIFIGNGFENMKKELNDPNKIYKVNSIKNVNLTSENLIIKYAFGVLNEIEWAIDIPVFKLYKNDTLVKSEINVNNKKFDDITFKYVEYKFLLNDENESDKVMDLTNLKLIVSHEKNISLNNGISNINIKNEN